MSFGKRVSGITEGDAQSLFSLETMSLGIGCTDCDFVIGGNTLRLMKNIDLAIYLPRNIGQMAHKHKHKKNKPIKSGPRRKPR